MKRISFVFFVTFILFVGCFKQYKSEKQSKYIIWVDSILSFDGSFSNIEAYLKAPQHMLDSFNKGSEDLSCRTKEAIRFLEITTDIKASKAYEISEIKLPEEDLSLLAKDLEKWKSWYQDNKQYLFFNEDKKTMIYKNRDIERVVSIPESKCKIVCY